MKNYFESFDNGFIISLGAMCEITGTRPSEFFEWTDPDEYIQRMMFDMRILNTYKEHEAREMKRKR